MKIVVLQKKEEGKSIARQKLELAGTSFSNGFLDQMADEKTIWTSVGVGLWQGLKYKGSLRTGTIAGITTQLVLCCANGLIQMAKALRHTDFYEEA